MPPWCSPSARCSKRAGGQRVRHAPPQRAGTATGTPRPSPSSPERGNAAGRNCRLTPAQGRVLNPIRGPGSRPSQRSASKIRGPRSRDRLAMSGGWFPQRKKFLLPSPLPSAPSSLAPSLTAGGRGMKGPGGRGYGTGESTAFALSSPPSPCSWLADSEPHTRAAWSRRKSSQGWDTAFKGDGESKGHDRQDAGRDSCPSPSSRQGARGWPQGQSPLGDRSEAEPAYALARVDAG